MKNSIRGKSNNTYIYIYKAYGGIVGYLFFLILLALLFLAATSTCFIDAKEKIYYVQDRVIGNIAISLFALLGSLFVFRAKKKYVKIRTFFERIEADEAFFNQIRKTILICYGIAAGLWVLSTQIVPGADQNIVLRCAHDLARRNLSAVGEPSYYLTCYNNQIGLVVAEWLLGYIVGFLNYQAFQLINAGIAAGILLQLSILGDMFGMSKQKQLSMLLLGALYLPLFFYTNFVYGTLPGLLLSLLAIKYELRFLRGGKWHEAMVSALCIGIAVMIKMNYLIFMIAILLYAMKEGLCGKARRSVLLCASVILALIIQAAVPKMAVERWTGKEISKGLSSWSWIVMGLMDGDAPGWWNKYNMITFAESDYDRQKQEIWVKSDLKLRLGEMMNDRDASRTFFVRKTASQWNEPTLQSLWVSYVQKSEIDNIWTKEILSEGGNSCFTKVMNSFQFVILSGSLLYMMFCREKEGYYESLLLPMIVVGGFLFHLVWEAKGQYIFPYFILLLPYTVMGFGEATEKIGALLCRIPGKTSIVWLENRNMFLKDVLLFVLAVLILWYVFHGTMDSLTVDTDRYPIFIEQQMTEALQ